MSALGLITSLTGCGEPASTGWPGGDRIGTGQLLAPCNRDFFTVLAKR